MTGVSVVQTALWSLGRNKLRSGLTMLGIIIGVAAVVGMVALGQGAMKRVEDDISGMGVNLITVSPGSKKMGGAHLGAGAVSTLVPDDARALLEECPTIGLVSECEKSGCQAVYHDQNSQTSVQGGNSDYLAIRDWPLSEGSFFDADQVRRGNKVCVLGTTVVSDLFGTADPIGEIIRIKHVPFQVIGVLESKGQSSQGQDQDDVIMMPWTTQMRRLMGISYLKSIVCSARTEEQLDEATEQVRITLRRRHKITPGQDDDFQVQNQTELLETKTATARFMMLLVVVVAAIALVVGGIGVMNIMLVSVLERTREIGIRMAIGAKQRDIILQFLGEAVMLTSLGGLIGIALGIGSALLIPVVLGWPTYITPLPIAISFIFSALVGVFFGLYPAMRASQLDPIDALRYE